MRRMLVIWSVLALTTSFVALCRAQDIEDPDCTPAAQKLAHSFEDNNTFAGDPTLQAILRYAIEKCEQTSDSSTLSSQSQADIDRVIADGNKEAAADRAMLKVWDATHDSYQAEQAKEITEREFDQIEATRLAKSSGNLAENPQIITSITTTSTPNSRSAVINLDQLRVEMHALNAELGSVRQVTIDKFNFSDPNQRAAYQTAWKSFSDAQLAKFRSDIAHIWPSLQFAADHEAGSEFKSEESFLIYAKSDILDEILRRERAACHQSRRVPHP